MKLRQDPPKSVAEAQAERERQGSGRGYKVSTRHSGDGRAGQGSDPTWLYFHGAGGGRDDQPDDNAFLAKKCQQTLSVDATISSLGLILWSAAKRGLLTTAFATITRRLPAEQGDVA